MYLSCLLLRTVSSLLFSINLIVCFLSPLSRVRSVFVDSSPRHERSWNRRPPCAPFRLVSLASRLASPHFALCPPNPSHHILSWTTDPSRGRYYSYRATV